MAKRDNDISPELAFSNYIHNVNEFPTTKPQPEQRERDGVLYRWAGTHWSAVPVKVLERVASDWLADNAPDKCNIRTAGSCAATAIQRAAPLPIITHTVIPTMNGYLHIKDGEITLLQPDAGLGVTYCLACHYNPTANVNQFISFMNEVLPDAEVRAYLQEYAGYTLLPDCRHQLACWLIGGGGNGKSTFAQIMQALHRNPVSMQLDALDGFNLAGLIGASLVYCDETPVRIDEQRLKTLISGDSVQIDRKYRDPIVIRPTAKWFVSGNALSAISDHSDGFWRRWVIVPFNTKPKTIQPLLGDIIIADELSGVLNWALEGLRRLLQRGKFPPLPAALLEAQKTGKQQSNSVSAWVADCEAVTTTSDGEVISKKFAYFLYSNWCKRNGTKPVSSFRFWDRMELLFSDKLNYGRERCSSGQVRVVNIEFKNMDANQELFAEASVSSPSCSSGDYERASRG